MFVHGGGVAIVQSALSVCRSLRTRIGRVSGFEPAETLALMALIAGPREGSALRTRGDRSIRCACSSAGTSARAALDRLQRLRFVQRCDFELSSPLARWCTVLVAFVPNVRVVARKFAVRAGIRSRYGAIGTIAHGHTRHCRRRRGLRFASSDSDACQDYNSATDNTEGRARNRSDLH